MDKIGLVTVTYNGEKVIEDFIDSVKSQDYADYVLYVVDNNSTDNTVDIIEQKADLSKTLIIKNRYNNGVAGGNNQGILRALEDGCEYIVLINNDTKFEPSLLSKLYCKSKVSGYKVIVPKMMYYDDPDVIWFGGGYLKKETAYLNYHEGTGEKDTGQYQDREITYAPTCCALIHSSVFEDIGIMDEKYFVYFDDTDFFYRMLKDGRNKMFYINDVQFYHKVGSSTKSKNGTRQKFKFGDFVIKYNTRNKVYYFKKQSTLRSHLNIIWFWIRLNLRFLFSGKYTINFKTWKLIQTSFFEGLKL